MYAPRLARVHGAVTKSGPRLQQLLKPPRGVGSSVSNMAVKVRSHDTRPGGGFLSEGKELPAAAAASAQLRLLSLCLYPIPKCQATDRRVIEVNLRGNGERLRAPEVVSLHHLTF